MKYAAAVTWRSFSFGEAINTQDLTFPLISICKLFSVSPEHGQACSWFAVIGCLGIRLGPVSFHARDDNNGCHCRDDCWHHYSCVLPHASIFTCCTDAPEVNEFFTLEFRAGSHRHIASHMRGAQQVKPKDLPPLIFLSYYHITWAFFFKFFHSADWYLIVHDLEGCFWSRFRCMMLSSSETCWEADVPCFKIICIEIVSWFEGLVLFSAKFYTKPHHDCTGVSFIRSSRWFLSHGWYNGNTICNPAVLMPCYPLGFTG